jgi:hypothetical protein
MTIDRTNYQVLLIEVKDRIRSAQYAALKAVNHELIALYWIAITRASCSSRGKSSAASRTCFNVIILIWVDLFLLLAHGHDIDSRSPIAILLCSSICDIT